MTFTLERNWLKSFQLWGNPFSLLHQMTLTILEDLVGLTSAALSSFMQKSKSGYFQGKKKK